MSLRSSLTTVMNVMGILGGFAAEDSHYGRADAHVFPAGVLPDPVLRSDSGNAQDHGVWIHHRDRGVALGVNTTRGTEGVGQASTRSVVLSSMLLILANVLLVRIIFFFYPA